MPRKRLTDLVRTLHRSSFRSNDASPLATPEQVLARATRMARLSGSGTQQTSASSLLEQFTGLGSLGGGLFSAIASPSSALKSIESGLIGALGPVGLAIKGIASLFGGSPSTPPPLQYFTGPRSINFQAAETSPPSAALGSALSASLTSLVYDQGGMPRAAGGPVLDPSQLSPKVTFDPAIVAAGNYTTAPAAPAPAAAPQNFDLDFFMAHSQEIASAVRDAMLNSHPLNDVVQNL